MGVSALPFDRDSDAINLGNIEVVIDDDSFNYPSTSALPSPVLCEVAAPQVTADSAAEEVKWGNWTPEDLRSAISEPLRKITSLPSSSLEKKTDGSDTPAKGSKSLARKKKA